MRVKTEKRIYAEKLRKDLGLSYSDIAELTGISKSTLSAWLKDITLSTKQQEQLQKNMMSNRDSFARRAWIINHERFLDSQEKARKDGMDILTRIPANSAVDELALAMLYLGEGSKSYGRVQIASTDARILRYFLLMLRRLYHIEENRMSFRLNLIDIARSVENDFIRWWKNELCVPDAKFLKTQYDSRSRKKTLTGEYHGVCTLTYNDTYLQRRIINLAYTYINSVND